MTDTLQRITTEYIEAEDRIRLAGEASEKTVVLWLTQRLLNRLIPHLCQWLPQRAGATVLVKKSDRLLFVSFWFARQSVSGLFLLPASTTGVDDLTGTDGDDTFNASLSLQDPTDNTTITQTLTSFDEVDGGEGTDRLNATLDSAVADNVVVTDVENIYLRSRDNAAAIDMDNVSGAEQLWSDRSTNNLTLTNVQNGVTVGLNDVDASSYSVTYAAGVLASPAYTQNVVANGSGDRNGDLVLNVVAAGGDAITGLNVATTDANFVGLVSAGLANVETLTVTGSGSLMLMAK